MSSPEASTMQEQSAALRIGARTVAAWRTARNVPFRLTITIPIAGVKLRDLLLLQAGSTLRTTISASDDVPVRVGGALLGWAELDNVDDQMAIRLTRLT